MSHYLWNVGNAGLGRENIFPPLAVGATRSKPTSSVILSSKMCLCVALFSLTLTELLPVRPTQ